MILRSPKSRHFFSFTANGFSLRSVSDRRKLKKRSLDTILGVHTGGLPFSHLSSHHIFQLTSSFNSSYLISSGPNGRRLGEKGHTPQDYLKFKDLLERFEFIDLFIVII
jgi:hypothetical protein